LVFEKKIPGFVSIENADEIFCQGEKRRWLVKRGAASDGRPGLCESLPSRPKANPQPQPHS
jgi:hypothetical protein